MENGTGKNDTCRILKQEIMLQINERLYKRGEITKEVCDAVKVRILAGR